MALLPTTALAQTYVVDPEAGNSTFDAVFDAPLGERIHAVSSALACAVDYDAKSGTVKGSCSVPLVSIMVDNEPTKTEHFQQWSTNKKSEPKDCKFEANLDGVKLGVLQANKSVPFTADVPFIICGRARTGGGKEKLVGKALLLPAGSDGEKTTVRVQATVAKFNREKYGIGPAFTEGWLARVQQLAKVVAPEGTIELRLFAHPKEEASAKK